MMFSKDEFEIKRLFAKYGKVTYVRLVRDTKTLRSKGFAFVQMPNALDAKRAIEKLNGMILDDRTLKVSVAADNGKATKSSSTSVKTEAGLELSNKSPVVQSRSKSTNDIEARSSKRRRARGLDLLFKNTKSLK
jgi:RNA recognition motif-containing protein